MLQRDASGCGASGRLDGSARDSVRGAKVALSDAFFHIKKIDADHARAFVSAVLDMHFYTKQR